MLAQFIEFIRQVIDIFLHLDKHLAEMTQALGAGSYILLFLVIFLETGIVVTPFLPGDSLLFAAGALAALPNSAIKIEVLLPLLWVAAVIGDFSNYHIGKYLGPKVFREGNRFLNKRYLDDARDFFERYGGKAVVFARFLPIFRTFVPFVAGIGSMNYTRFFAYNIVGGFVWVLLFTLAGYFLGNVPAIQKNFHIMIFAIIGISLLPAVFEFSRRKLRPAKAS